MAVLRVVGVVAVVCAVSAGFAAADQLSVDAGIQLESRNFDGASVEQRGNILAFSGSAMPMAFASAQVWFGPSLGMSTHLATTVEAQAKTSLGEELGTELNHAHVSGLWRRVAGQYTASAELGLGRTTMRFDPSDINFFIPTDMPGIDYRYLRAGAQGHYDQGFATLHGGIGAMVGRDHGLVAKYLGDTIAGVDFELGASAELRDQLELRLTLNLRDIYHTDTDLSDDRFYGARVTLAYTR